MDCYYEIIYDCLKNQKYPEQIKMLNEFIDSYNDENEITVKMSKASSDILAVYKDYKEKEIKIPDKLYLLKPFNFLTPKVIEVSEE
jgi:hypothetical protein